jgi:3-oxoacyl-[acyl-carrier protein] reductase
MEADLADPAAAGRVFDAAERELGAVSILVNNASGWRPDTFSGATTDQFNRPVQPVSAETISAQLDVDARGGALLIAELSGRLRRHGHRWGRIVSLSSGGGNGFPDEVSYGAAKAALQNFTLSAAAELADIGVTANVVHPPITDTGWVTEEVRRFARAHDVRVVQPDEVASVVGWLCTDAARLVTGNVVRLH